MMSPSSKMGRLRSIRSGTKYSALGVATYISLVSVPWWLTITSFKVGSKPTNPAVNIWSNSTENFLPMYYSQNCVRSPSPPDAIGTNRGLAWQFAPQFHANVAAGWQ